MQVVPASCDSQHRREAGEPLERHRPHTLERLRESLEGSYEAGHDDLLSIQERVCRVSLTISGTRKTPPQQLVVAMGRG